MWVWEKIREDLERISPQCLGALHQLDALPQEKAVSVAAYLWEGCFQSSNCLWVVLCGGLLYRIPQDWLAAHILEILERTNVDWQDGFEFYNLCAAFYHAPDILAQILEYAKEKIPPERTEEWISDMEERAGSREHSKSILEEFERLKNIGQIDLQ